MQKVIIFCLLLVLIVSKTEFGEVQCNSTLSKEECPATKITSKDEVCCYSEERKSGSENPWRGYCDNFHKEYLKMLKMKEYKALWRELKGYYYYVGKQTLEDEIYYCPNDEIKFEYRYNENEIQTLKNEDLCFNINYKKSRDASFKVGECEKYSLLESSKNNGIECGTTSANIVFSSGVEFNWKTCDYFNLKLVELLLRVHHSYSNYFNNTIKDIIELNKLTDQVKSYTIQLYNTKGDKILYDSETNETTIIEGPSDPSSSSCMLFASKYLLLLILILF